MLYLEELSEYKDNKEPQFEYGERTAYKGACASVETNRYSTLVCKELGAEEKNYGVSGTRIAKQIHPNVAAKEDDKDFITRAPTMDKEADFVFVFGGTNDYGHGDAPLGSMSDKTQYSFYGAMK